MVAGLHRHPIHMRANSEVAAMKIVLIKAPYLQIFGPMQKSAPRYFPLGLGYIAAALQQAGHDVVFLDPEIQGLSDAACMQRLQSERPALVGIGCATPNFTAAQLRWITSPEVALANLQGAVGLLRKTWQIASSRRYSDYG